MQNPPSALILPLRRASLSGLTGDQKTILLVLVTS